MTGGQLWHHCASLNDSHHYVTYEMAIWDSIFRVATHVVNYYFTTTFQLWLLPVLLLLLLFKTNPKTTTYTTTFQNESENYF